MERAIIHSNLKKQEIQPSEMLMEYKSLLSKDIKKLFLAESLQKAFCPVTGEKDIKKSFSSMGMEYNVSRSMGNIYISPKPTMKSLRTFYLESEARKFWLRKLWPETKVIRKEKIIMPQLEWVHGFMNQYFFDKKISIAEFLPNHWGYGLVSDQEFPNVNYTLVDALFDLSEIDTGIKNMEISESVENNSKDAIFLFEAIDRSPNPAYLLASVIRALKPGGLCFITCLLSSGFEIQVLGKESSIFVPPERMNLLSYEGMLSLIDKTDGLEILEFSTPGVLDIPNVTKKLEHEKGTSFFNYILKEREDSRLIESFQDFIQFNCLGTFGRLVLKKL